MRKISALIRPKRCSTPGNCGVCTADEHEEIKREAGSEKGRAHARAKRGRAGLQSVGETKANQTHARPRRPRPGSADRQTRRTGKVAVRASRGTAVAHVHLCG